MKWNKEYPIIMKDPIRNPKRITGTRFPAVIGYHPWQSPFEIWCAVTRTYEKPFEDNKYTIAGKAIEPIIIQYLRDIYFGDECVIDPTQVFGEDPFRSTKGNFFPDHEIFGGMWDALLVDEGTTTAVIEIKTTSRIDNWLDGAPDYQALQGALYAHLLGVDTVIMVVAALEDTDYSNPSGFVPTAANVHLDEFNIYERYPNFDEMINQATNWWNTHVKGSESPFYDERKDAEILKELRTIRIEPEDEDIATIIKEAGELYAELEAEKEKRKDKEKRLKGLEDTIKKHLIEEMGEGDTIAVAVSENDIVFEVKKDTRESIDKKALENDGLLDKYTIKTDTYTLRKKENK